MAEHDAADQKHFQQITLGKLVAQAPEDREGNDIAGILRSRQNAPTPLVELLAAGAATESTVNLLAPFRNGC